MSTQPGNDEPYDSLAEEATQEDVAKILTLVREADEADDEPASLQFKHADDVTDVKVAERYAELGGRGRFRYTEGLGWYRWTGIVWEALAGSGTVERDIAQFAVALQTCNPRPPALSEADAADPRASSTHKAASALAASIKGYQSGAKISAVLKIFSALEGVATRSDEWDAEDGLIVFANGVLQARELFLHGMDASLLEHSPDRLVTGSIPHEWHAGEQSARWETYLSQALPVASVRRYLQKAAGYALLGSTREKAIFNLIGEGDTGKSLFLDVVRVAVGSYGAWVPVTTFLQKQGGGSDFDRDKLRGSRVVGTSEPSKGSSFDDDLLKSVSGGDAQTTAAKFKASTTWTPRCTIFIASNHSVKFDTTDAAFLKRIKPIRFPQVFADRVNGDLPEGALEKDRHLDSKIKAPADEDAGLVGVVAWLVEGASLYMSEGLEEPEEVAKERSAMQTDLEGALQWVEEALIEGWLKVNDAGVPASHGAKISELYALYTLWERHQGTKHIIGRRTFSKVLQTRYGSTTVSAGTRLPALAIERAALSVEQEYAL